MIRMLTRLRLKNWRSIKDETIDFTPITVFIGANSSGKTNILDALYFLRTAVTWGIREAIYAHSGLEKVRTIGTKDPAINLGFTFSSQRKNSGDLLTYTLKVLDEDLSPSEDLTDEQGIEWLTSEFRKAKARNSKDVITEADLSVADLGVSAFGRISSFPQIQNTFQFITQRWQMLDENFMPPLTLPTGSVSPSSAYLIDRCADNLPMMLDIMYKTNEDLYGQLQEDFRWLLGHVEKIETKQTDNETRTLIREATHNGKEAPTISAGTRRILAMLTAYYALDMRLDELPGLIAIEEPDTALNPMLLQNFVEQLRNYVEGEHPRQFILTTHNPLFLNYFKPEEVRVVERDEHGYTTVHKIPDHIEEIWLKDGEYRLGDVWMTRSLGGVPE